MISLTAVGLGARAASALPQQAPRRAGGAPGGSRSCSESTRNEEPPGLRPGALMR